MTVFTIKAFQLILSLSFLVFMHEFGHFFFARLFKIRVEKFYLFFNPWYSIVRWKKVEGKWHVKFFSKNDNSFATNDNCTEWGIGWLPLGGYCKVAGMMDESIDTKQLKRPVQEWEFRAKPAWQRFFVMLGGVLVNFLLAICIYSLFAIKNGETYVEMSQVPLAFCQEGQEAGFRNGDKVLFIDENPSGELTENTLLSIIEAQELTILRNDSDTLRLAMPSDAKEKMIYEQKDYLKIFFSPIVSNILDESPARKILAPDDKFLSLKGSAIESFEEMLPILEENKDNVIDATILRGKDTLSIQLPLMENGKIGFIAKQPFDYQHRDLSFWGAIRSGSKQCTDFLTFYTRQLKYIPTQKGMESMGGVGAMGSLFPSLWSWSAFWHITAILSLIFAVMNILPIPALDGGHLLFLLIEMIFRRKVSDDVIMVAQFIGMAFLFTLMIYANAMDVVRLFR